MSTYFVDIDSTIASTPEENGYRIYEKSQPIPCRIKKINDLFDAGHTVIYWTARGASTGRDWRLLTTEQLLMWGCKFHELRMNKPAYDVFICDKAVNSEDFFNEN